jgi:tetratricopeptide (TPR) repeat protein
MLDCFYYASYVRTIAALCMRAFSFSPSKETLLTIVGFFAISIAIYGFTLPHLFVSLNDSELVYRNPIVQQISPGTIKAAFTHYDPELYIPLTFLSYQLDWFLGNGSAFVFHLDNLLLHTLNALLVCWLFFLYSRNRWIGLFCGLIFLVHPISTETVLWVSSRKDLLSTLFGRLTLIAYMYYLFEHRKGFLYVSSTLFVFALLAKVKVIVLPLTLFLIDWKEGRPLSKEMFLEKIPYFCLSVIFGIIAFFGKADLLASSTFTTKIFLSVKSTALYLQHFFVPLHLSIYYPYLDSVSLVSPTFLVPLGCILLVIALACWSLRWTREIFFGCALYGIGIIASFSNLAKGTDLYLGSDRYAYSALIGITYALATGVLLLGLRYRSKISQRLRRFLWIVPTCIVLCFATLSYRQSLVWEDSFSLYRHVIAENPNYYLPYFDLGVADDEDGRPIDAIAAYEQSLQLSDFSLTHVNLGSDYYHQGNATEAHRQFLLALQGNPHFAMASFNLGVLDAESGSYETAKAYYQRSIADGPSFIDARLNLASMEADHGDTTQAVQDLKDAIAIDPENARTKSLMALFVQKGIL